MGRKRGVSSGGRLGGGERCGLIADAPNQLAGCGDDEAARRGLEQRAHARALEERADTGKRATPVVHRPRGGVRGVTGGAAVESAAGRGGGGFGVHRPGCVHGTAPRC